MGISEQVGEGLTPRLAIGYLDPFEVVWWFVGGM